MLFDSIYPLFGAPKSLQMVTAAMKLKDAYSLEDVDCSPPGSSIHGILQARILEWVAISLSQLGHFSKKKKAV